MTTSNEHSGRRHLRAVLEQEVEDNRPSAAAFAAYRRALGARDRRWTACPRLAQNR